jgi:hypothetical protein
VHVWPGSLIAIATWWRQPRLWWACLGILATTTGVMLYLPIQFALYTQTELDDVYDRLGIGIEFVVFCHFAIVVHLASLVAINLRWTEKTVAGKEKRGNEERK